jgi:predicted tellurium resistance membrane protein TerC
LIGWISDPQAWVSLLTLSVLEIVLGIDNVVFISILSGRLPPERQRAARRLGLVLALATRLGLLFTITWIMGLTRPAFAVLGQAFSWRDLILLSGGLFLVWKGTQEIHAQIEHADVDTGHAPKTAGTSFAGVVLQIAVMDMVFSLDSVITAVGMVSHVPVMVAAIVVAMAVMLVAAGPLSDFIQRHPTVKVLALSFLMLIGMALMADGFGVHVPRGYIYAAIGFSCFVEAINLAARRRRAASQAVSGESQRPAA